jgi:hypothetical protein
LREVADGQRGWKRRGREERGKGGKEGRREEREEREGRREEREGREGRRGKEREKPTPKVNEALSKTSFSLLVKTTLPPPSSLSSLPSPSSSIRSTVP